MKIELVSIGDELLIGQTVNTNASWLGKEISQRGGMVTRVVTISDEAEEIEDAINQGFKRADVVIMTGGLGPTQDDITKQTVAKYFGRELILHQPTLDVVKQFFQKANRPMLEVNRFQAYVPEGCEVLMNEIGTAPGMWMERNQKILINLAGVPYEMKHLMNEKVFPKLAERGLVKQQYSKTILVQGVGESYLADKMQSWEDDIRSKGLKLAYLPSPGLIKLRITSLNGEQDTELIEDYFKQLEQAYPEQVFGYGDDTLPEVVGRLLTKSGQTVSTAESCTGGALGAAIVSVPGSSNYFNGGFLTYTNQMKHDLLGVKMQHFETVGAVSKEVVEEMAVGGRQKAGTDFCVALSGIAGPGGGSEEKPVGTVWIAVASVNRVVAKKFLFNDSRARVIDRAVLSALNMLRNELVLQDF